MDARKAARLGGWCAIVAGVTGVLGAALLLVLPPGAPADQFNYPLAPAWFAVVQAAFCVHHLLMAVALWAFGRAGLAGAGPLAAIGVWGSVGVLALLGVWELAALFGIGHPYPSDDLVWLDTGYGALSLLAGVFLVVLGVAAARAHVLTGWARWMPLVTGVYLFVPMIPGLFAGFVVGRLVLAVWLALFALLGWAMLRWAAGTETEPALATTRSATP